MALGTAIFILGILWLPVTSRGFRIMALIAGATVSTIFVLGITWSMYWPRHVLEPH